MTKKTANERFLQQNRHLASPRRINIHLDSLPDDSLVDVLRIVTTFPVYEAQPQLKERNAKAQKFIDNWPGVVLVRKFLHDTAQIYPEYGMEFLEIE